MQADAILQMQLRRLTALEADKIRLEHEDLVTKIADYKDILGRRERVFGIIEDELGLKHENSDNMFVFDKKTLEAAIKRGMRMSVLADDGLAVEEAALEESCRALQTDLWKVDLAWQPKNGEERDPHKEESSASASKGPTSRFKGKYSTRVCRRRSLETYEHSSNEISFRPPRVRRRGDSLVP